MSKTLRRLKFSAFLHLGGCGKVDMDVGIWILSLRTKAGFGFGFGIVWRGFESLRCGGRWSWGWF